MAGNLISECQICGFAFGIVCDAFVIFEQYCSWTNPVSYCYCGPATAYSILQEMGFPTSHDGEALSQNKLAANKYLETDANGGTPWTGAGGDHPMPESLNYWRTGSYSGYYEADGLGMPTPAPDTSTFENDVRFDIDYGYPLAQFAFLNKSAVPAFPVSQNDRR